MTTVEILDDEDSYDLTDVEPEYDLLVLREQARREGREYRGVLLGYLGDNDYDRKENHENITS